MKTRAGWISATEAMAILGVRPQTLYAYVSRGRIQTRPDADDPRRSHYRAADVQRLAGRRLRGRRIEAVAADAIAWGEPVLPTAIATVAQERLFYRGRDAVELAESATLEEVAALLWGADAAVPPPQPSRRLDGEGATPGIGLFVTLAAAAERGEPAWGRAPAALRHEAGELLVTIADVFASKTARRAAMPIHLRLATQWRCDKAGTDLIRRALVLLAEHELNASTFAARVAASTGASLAAGVLAGLCAFSGPLHGGAAAQAAALVADAERMGADSAIRSWLAQGRRIPACGHPLYANGDVRALALLRAFRPSPIMQTLARATAEITGEIPNIDFAITALAKTLSLPMDAPFVLFVMARSAGWLAHTIEQVASGHLIRPRARYIGPQIPAVPANNMPPHSGKR